MEGARKPANPLPTLRQPFTNLSPTLCQPFCQPLSKLLFPWAPRHPFRDTGTRSEIRVNGFLVTSRTLVPVIFLLWAGCLTTAPSSTRTMCTAKLHVSIAFETGKRGILQGGVARNPFLLTTSQISVFVLFLFCMPIWQKRTHRHTRICKINMN